MSEIRRHAAIMAPEELNLAAEQRKKISGHEVNKVNQHKA
jgi:hypothetical protein